MEQTQLYKRFKDGLIRVFGTFDISEFVSLGFKGRAGYEADGSGGHNQQRYLKVLHDHGCDDLPFAHECICGTRIDNNYVAMHTPSRRTAVIGSCCIRTFGMVSLCSRCNGPYNKKSSEFCTSCQRENRRNKTKERRELSPPPRSPPRHRIELQPALQTSSIPTVKTREQLIYEWPLRLKQMMYQGLNQTLYTGRHKGRTYSYVQQNDPSYVSTLRKFERLTFSFQHFLSWVTEYEQLLDEGDTLTQ